MEITERRKPDLTPGEWSLLLELLDREDAQLPVEIHHSATRRMRELLRDRKRLVEQLRLRIREAVPEADAQAATDER